MGEGGGEEGLKGTELGGGGGIKGTELDLYR